MLKVSIDHGRDYLDYLKPYVALVLGEAPPERITDAAVAECLQSLCGLVIPVRSVQLVLQRLSRAGFLVRESGSYKIANAIPYDGVVASRVAAQRHINAVLFSLIEYAKKEAKKDIDEDEAIDCIISFLAEFSIPCLKSYLRGTTLPTPAAKSDWQVTLVSQFVTHIGATPDLFDWFMELAQGHMLANALLCPDLNAVTTTYKDVVFYLDTPLLIQFLGLEGDPERLAMEELVLLLKSLSGVVACFSHTLDELVHAIKQSAEFIDHPKGRGTIVMEARRSAVSKSDLVLAAGKAQETIERGGVKVIDAPSYDERHRKFEIDARTFTAVLNESVRYNNENAKEYDVKSVRSIYVLRGGSSPVSVEKARAVLVTSNVSFARAAYEYGKNFEQSKEVSTVITDFSLANIAWLKAPLSAPSLPRKEVISFAYAAQKPTMEFWSKVLLETDKLERSGTISARDHQLLRSNPIAQTELMRLTLGQDDALTAETITETVARVTEEIQSEGNAKAVAERRLREEIQASLSSERERLDRIKSTVFKECSRLAAREATELSILVWLTQFAIALYGVLAILGASDGIGWAVLLIAIASGVVRLAGVRWDLKPVKLGPAYREWRTKTLLRARQREIGLEPAA